MADYRQLIEQVPPVTRFLLVATAVCTFPVLLGILDPRMIYLSWPLVRFRYQIYRPLTAFFFGGSGFPLLYDFFLIYRNSSALEKETYMSNTAGYAWASIVTGALIHVFNIPFGQPFLFRPLLHAQNYLWCRANPSMKISIFGLLSVPVPLYPFALIVLDLVLGGMGKALQGVIGLLAGHTWWFLSTYLPLHPSASIRMRNPLGAPRWFTSLSPSHRSNGPTIQGAGFSGFAGRGAATGGGGSAAASGSSTARAQAGAAAATRRYNWGGSGQRLGGDGL